MNIINQLLQFWFESHWLIAFFMSSLVNIMVYVFTAHILSKVIVYIVQTRQHGEYIDRRLLKDNQIKTEFKNGVVACVVFAGGSLASRELFVGFFPDSFMSLLFQVLGFIVFYESYSYLVHRLMHLKFLSKYHYVHHKSVRVTPWSSYSVHYIEAFFIGISAPIFMLLLPLSLSVALVLHILGMMFTILLHCNLNYTANNVLLKIFFSYPSFHSKHHAYGNVNYGFVNKVWDSWFSTLYKKA